MINDRMDRDRRRDMIFGKRKKPDSAGYDKSEKIPVIRSSICTGEQVAGFKTLSNGKFEDLRN